jgi:hypothetical protein
MINETQYNVEGEKNCWVWQRSKDRDGYGRITHERRRRQAHVVYYEHFVGPLEKGKVLDHLCRRRDCVNPSHLEPVTNLVNVRRSNRTKLREEQVQTIKQLLPQHSDRQIADMFMVSPQLVRAIRVGRSWKDVT